MKTHSTQKNEFNSKQVSLKLLIKHFYLLKCFWQSLRYDNVMINKNNTYKEYSFKELYDHL